VRGPIRRRRLRTPWWLPGKRRSRLAGGCRGGQARRRPPGCSTSAGPPGRKRGPGHDAEGRLRDPARARRDPLPGREEPDQPGSAAPADDHLAGRVQRQVPPDARGLGRGVPRPDRPPGRRGQAAAGAARSARRPARASARRGRQPPHRAPNARLTARTEVNPLQRIWRDSAVAARHVVTLPEVNYEIYGKALLDRDDQITPLI
jgi:hypothetical protein